MIVGLIETIGRQGTCRRATTDFIAFFVFIVVSLIKPTGIFQREDYRIVTP